MDLHLLIAVFHVAFVVPLFLWVGFNRAATPEWAYTFLTGLGILVFLYHGYKAVGRWFAKSPVIWVNLIHMILVAPLLLWIGYNGKKTERPAYEMLLLLAFGALGYHLYTMVLVSQTFVKDRD